MGKETKRHKGTDKETKAKGKSKESTNQRRNIVRGTVNKLSSGWLQNSVVGLVILLLGPAIGMITKSPKIAIICGAMGLTILIWIVAVIAIRQASNGQAQETETHGLLVPANDPEPLAPCGNV